MANAGGWQKAIGPLHPMAADVLDWFANAIEDVEKLGVGQARLEQQVASRDVKGFPDIPKVKKS
jgi:hypothetical protein